jgi:hypothetical protein
MKSHSMAIVVALPRGRRSVSPQSIQTFQSPRVVLTQLQFLILKIPRIFELCLSGN